MARISPWLAAGGIAALAAAGSVQGQTRGGAGFWLVGLPEGANASGVRALSQDGLVAGGGSFVPATNKSGSFRWTAIGGRDDWGFLPGTPQRNVVYGCDNSGLIVAGTMSTPGVEPDRPFRCIGSGPIVDLGIIAGQTRSYAHGISGDGSIVVGHAENGPNSYQYGRAWRWSQAGGMQNLGALTNQSFLSDARAISRDGKTIVGLNINEGLAFQAFTWREGEGMKTLPSLTAIPSASATAVNADGTVVVGSSSSASGWSHAVRWVDGKVEDLVSPVLVNKHSGAYAVSDDGGITIGSYSQSGIGVAFVWSKDTGMKKAVDYLALHDIVVPSGYTLEALYTISGDGLTFGGYARHAATNVTDGFVARLPGASGACLPDCDESGQLNIDDFICFQTYFALGDAKADCDASGNLDIDDFICFQTNFAIGC